MCKKLIPLILVVLSVLSRPAQAFRQDEITMLVVPVEKNPVQIAQDISRRYPVLIVSYELVKGKWYIYAWDDEKWVPVSEEDYADGIFFANRPAHTIVVEHEKFHAPAFLTPNSIWCESASRISSTDPRVMLHLLGLHFDFPYRHWNQLAKRYGYELEEINPTLENVHWWNIRGDALIEKRAKRDFSIDLDKHHYLATLPPPAVEPVMLGKEPVIPEVEKPASEPAAGAVNITVKAPEVKPAPAVSKPLPSLKPEPVIKPVAAVQPAQAAEKVKVPEVKAVPAPAAEPAPVAEPVTVKEPVPAPLIETAASAVPAEPAAEPVSIEADPFSAGEVPAAEIVVPQEPKKPWWKLF